MTGANGAALSSGMMGSAPPERTWSSKYHGRPRAFGCTNSSPRMRSSGRFSPLPPLALPSASYFSISANQFMIARTPASV